MLLKSKVQKYLKTKEKDKDVLTSLCPRFTATSENPWGLLKIPSGIFLSPCPEFNIFLKKDGKDEQL